MQNMPPKELTSVEKLAIKFSTWIGSVSSLIVHTILFTSAFMFIIFGAPIDKVLLVLTTVVSLEAIYLSIFIQMSVNRNTKAIEVVEADIEELSDDVEEIGEDIEEMSDDVEEIAKDVEGIEKDIDEIQEDVQEIQEDVEIIEKDIDEIQEDVEEISEDVEEIQKEKI